MNKLTKLQMEIDKIKQKISEQQTRLRELEQQKTEIENTEIVELVRSMKMNTSELSTFLKAYREMFFASTFCRKLQVKNTECCIMENP